MKTLLAILFTCTLLSSCKKTVQLEQVDQPDFQEIKTTDYELVKPAGHLEKVLVLFGGFPETVADIKREFKILEHTRENSIAVLLMNYNRKLWLEEAEKQALAEQLQAIFDKHNLPKVQVYFGGFSSGGNVALLISDFLIKQQVELKPAGVFVVDAPIDLAALYQSAEKNVQRNFSTPAVQEGTWLLETLGKQFGHPDQHISNYESYAVYTSETNEFDNIKNLQQVKLRFYSEPDTLWWKTHRMVDFDQMNACYLEKLSNLLQQSGFEQVAYIATANKGYRANGERHPHSWSIVNKKELIAWMKE